MVTTLKALNATAAPDGATRPPVPADQVAPTASITPIPLEERIGRVRSGLPADPAFAVGVLRELAGMSLYDLFDADTRKSGKFARSLSTPNVDGRCPLGKVVALSRACRQSSEKRPDYRAAGTILAEGPFALPAGKKPQATRTPDGSTARKRAGGRPASWAAGKPEGAGSAACGCADGEGEGGSVARVPLSERLASRALSRQRILHSARKLHYIAYLESVDAATGRADADARRTWFEESWDVAPRVTFADIMAFAVEHPDDARVPRLFDEFVFAPLADIYASSGEPGALELPGISSE